MKRPGLILNLGLLAICALALLGLPRPGGAQTTSGARPLLANVIQVASNPPLVPPTGGCPGGTGGSVHYCTFQTEVLPYVRGVEFQLRWAQGQTLDGLDLGIESNTTQGSYSFTNTDTVIAGYTGQTCGANLPGGGAPCFVTLVDGSASSQSTNTNTPLYVYDLPWANKAPQAWVGGATYWWGVTVSYGGNFYQAQPSSGTCSGYIPPTTAGTCNWTSFSTTAPPQDASFSTSFPGTSNTNWPVNTVANVNSATACGGGACTDTLLQAGFPACFETPCFQAKRLWIAALQVHVAAASYASNVRILRNSLGNGGENFTRNAAQLQTITGNNGTTLQNTWVQAIAQLCINTVIDRPATAVYYLMTAISGGALGLTNAAADSMAANAVAAGMSFGAQGFEASDITAAAAGTACTDDWCALFKQYSGQVPLLELQTISQGSVSNAGSTGNLVYLFPMIALRYSATLYVETYWQDLYCAFDTNGYSDSSGCDSGNSPFIPWQVLFWQINNGIPTPPGYGLGRGSK